MVTVLLSGGLGNQMFQYAAAKALAKRLNTDLAIDTYNLSKKTQTTVRNFELDIFDTEYKFTSSLKGKLLIKGRPFIQKHRDFFLKLGFFTDTYAILYQPVFEKIKGNILMSGYFQNEKYFKSISQEIHTGFSFKVPLKGENIEIATRIAQTESVSVHIRRGDYISNKHAASNFITCDKEYYRKAIAHISTIHTTSSFFVFSDDMEWVRDNIDFGGNTVNFIDWNKDSLSYIDMQLMSLCKHNIIANSSFSWWGAWLNRNKEKIVIAPDKWFVDEKKNLLLDSFYPDGWIKLRSHT